MEREEFYASLYDSKERLEHSAKGTIWAKRNHKYISRVKDPYGKWVYKYADGSTTGTHYAKKAVRNGTVDEHGKIYDRYQKISTDEKRMFDKKDIQKDERRRTVNENITYGKLHIMRKAAEMHINAILDEKFIQNGAALLFRKVFKKHYDKKRQAERDAIKRKESQVKYPTQEEKDLKIISELDKKIGRPKKRKSIDKMVKKPLY